jgi:hypothetical protein
MDENPLVRQNASAFWTRTARPVKGKDRPEAIRINPTLLRILRTIRSQSWQPFS